MKKITIELGHRELKEALHSARNLIADATTGGTCIEGQALVEAATAQMERDVGTEAESAIQPVDISLYWALHKVAKAHGIPDPELDKPESNIIPFGNAG